MCPPSVSGASKRAQKAEEERLNMERERERRRLARERDDQLAARDDSAQARAFSIARSKSFRPTGARSLYSTTSTGAS